MCLAHLEAKEPIYGRQTIIQLLKENIQYWIQMGKRGIVFCWGVLIIVRGFVLGVCREVFLFDLLLTISCL